MSQPIIKTEETLIIETPERVQLAFALASIGNRFLAVAVDHAIQYLAIFIVAYAFLSASGAAESFSGSEAASFVQGMSKWTLAILIIALFLIFAGYFVFFEWLWNGQTPGKRLLKLRVIREDGRPITLWEAMTRNLLRIFDAIPGFVLPVYSIGLIAIFMSGRDQRIGDMFAGTVVVRERTDEAPTFAETFSNPMADAAFRRVNKPISLQADVNFITESEIEVVESFLRRRWDLTDRQRIWMAWRVALPLMYKLKPAYDLQNFSYEGFLEELVHRFYSKQRFLN
ncbi:MAG: RDD family protein [Pyrinomonadaceae bacterium]|nr:RDD family protein [Pyrinomonadaceae bacterium]